MNSPATDTPKNKSKRTAKVVEPPRWLNVQSRTFYYYKDAGGSESVRVDFITNSATYRMWLSILKAKNRSDKFWHDHAGNEPCPVDVTEWLERQGELRGTAEVMVRPKGRYFEVIGIKPARVN